MFEAKFKIKHRGCWTCGLSKFKSEFVTHNTVSLDEHLVQDVMEVSLANEHESIEIKKYLDSSAHITKCNVLEKTKNKIIFQIFMDATDTISIVHTIINNGCFVPNKVYISGGFEIWTMASHEKKFLNDAIEAIRQLGEFKLIHIKTSSFDGFNFSLQQEMVLKTAIALGYYNWPKNISAQELAKRLKLNKATLLEHLRKAEIKVMKKEFCIS